MKGIIFEYVRGVKYEAKLNGTVIGELWYYAGGSIDITLEGIDNSFSFDTPHTFIEAKAAFRKLYTLSMKGLRAA